MKEKHLMRFTTMLAAMLMGLAVVMSCSKDTTGIEDDSGSTPPPSTDDGIVVENSAIDTYGQVSDYDPTQMDNFIELATKFENLRLQYLKAQSNNWEGELFGGIGSKSDPSKIYSLIQEIAEKADEYNNAILELDDKMESETTRGVFKTVFDGVYAISNLLERRTDRVRKVLDENKVWGDAKAQKELYDALPLDLKKGTTSAQEWFINFNNYEYNSIASKVHAKWYEAGNGTGAPGALEKYFSTVNSNANGKNPVWTDVHEAGKVAVITAAQLEVAMLDVAFGGGISKFQDLNDICEETINLRKKLKEGTATTADLKAFMTLAATKIVQEKLGNMLPEGETLSDDVANEAITSMTEYLCEKAIDQTNKEAAEGVGVNITNVLDNMRSQGGVMVVIARNPETGKTTVTFPGTDGKKATVVTTKPKNDQLIISTVKGGQRVTQKVSTTDGEQNVDAMPSNEKGFMEVTPLSVYQYDWKGGVSTVHIRSNCKYLYAKSYNTNWCTILLESDGTLLVKTTQNPTNEKRETIIAIQASNDNKKAEKTIKMEVKQLGKAVLPDDIGDDLKISIDAWTSKNWHTGDYRLWEETIYGSSKNCSIQREGDAYIISGRFESPAEPSISPGAWDYAADKPYGTFADFSLKFGVNDGYFYLSDVRGTGYQKDVLETVHNGWYHGFYYDSYYTFNFGGTNIGLDKDAYKKHLVNTSSPYRLEFYNENNNGGSASGTLTHHYWDMAMDGEDPVYNDSYSGNLNVQVSISW